MLRMQLPARLMKSISSLPSSSPAASAATAATLEEIAANCKGSLSASQYNSVLVSVASEHIEVGEQRRDILCFFFPSLVDQPSVVHGLVFSSNKLNSCLRFVVWLMGFPLSIVRRVVDFLLLRSLS